MFRLRTILILVLIALVVYTLSPAERKQRLRGKLRELWTATVLALILYWAYMLAAAAWKHWGSD